MDLEYRLEGIGLSRQEALVYLASLKLGISKASVIAQKCNVGRGAVYYILKLLKEKGFVSEVNKSGVKFYSTIAPERIIEMIEDESEKKKTIIKEVLSELKNLEKSALNPPVIEVFEGVEGFKSLTSKLLEKPNQELRGYVSNKILEFMPHFHIQFRKRRTKRNIRIKAISERTPLLKEIKKLDKKELRRLRFNDNLFQGSDMLYYVLDDAVAIIKTNEKEQLGVYIKDKSLARLQKNIFDEIWKNSSSNY